MSTKNCLFDLFPIEIIEIILEYLSAYDIIYTLSNLTPHLNRIISNYHFYKINFESIIKPKFDMICHHIQGSQIKSLNLNDGDDTPDQSKLFLSLFTIEDLSLNLSHLSLTDVNNQSMRLILNNINKFNKLLSLKIIDNSNMRILLSKLKLIYPQLTQLNISSEYFVPNLIPMANLKYLILSTQCTLNQFQKLINHCPKLISLNLSLEKDINENISGIYLNLRKLIINMSSIFFRKYNLVIYYSFIV